MTGTLLLRHRLVVRFSDCDPLGHVNNAVYLTYLEQARIILWREQVGSLSRLRPDGTRGEGFILAHAEVDFRSQAHDGDELEVRLSLASFGRSSAVYEYEIVDVATGRLVADAKTVQVWFDYDAGKPVPLTDDTRRKLSRAIVADHDGTKGSKTARRRARVSPSTGGGRRNSASNAPE